MLLKLILLFFFYFFNMVPRTFRVTYVAYILFLLGSNVLKTVFNLADEACFLSHVHTRMNNIEPSLIPRIR